MMQSYASRVWLQSGGPILLTGIYAMVCYRVATTSDLHGRIRGHPNPTDELWSSVVQNHFAHRVLLVNNNSLILFLGLLRVQQAIAA